MVYRYVQIIDYMFRWDVFRCLDLLNLFHIHHMFLSGTHTHTHGLQWVHIVYRSVTSSQTKYVPFIQRDTKAIYLR